MGVSTSSGRHVALGSQHLDEIIDACGLEENDRDLLKATTKSIKGKDGRKLHGYVLLNDKNKVDGAIVYETNRKSPIIRKFFLSEKLVGEPRGRAFQSLVNYVIKKAVSPGLPKLLCRIDAEHKDAFDLTALYNSLGFVFNRSLERNGHDFYELLYSREPFPFQDHNKRRQCIGQLQDLTMLEWMLVDEKGQELPPRAHIPRSDKVSLQTRSTEIPHPGALYPHLYRYLDAIRSENDQGGLQPTKGRLKFPLTYLQVRHLTLEDDTLSEVFKAAQEISVEEIAEIAAKEAPVDTPFLFDLQ